MWPGALYHPHVQDNMSLHRIEVLGIGVASFALGAAGGSVVGALRAGALSMVAQKPI